MSTTQADLRRWFREGVESGATHMAVLVDRFDHEDYPVYVKPGQDPRQVVAQELRVDMTGLMEVYHLGMDMEWQIAQHRSMNYDLDPARAAAPKPPAKKEAPMQTSTPTFTDIAGSIGAAAEAAEQQLRKNEAAELARRQEHQRKVAEIFAGAMRGIPDKVGAAVLGRRPTCVVLEWNSGDLCAAEAASMLEQHLNQLGIKTSRGILETTELSVDVASLRNAAKKLATPAKP